ncbi:AAA domain-containing protein [Ditylenchus destructor]|nr:AAA domain-containing protein [Ditylenchus destructor]
MIRSSNNSQQRKEIMKTHLHPVYLQIAAKMLDEVGPTLWESEYQPVPSHISALKFQIDPNEFVQFYSFAMNSMQKPIENNISDYLQKFGTFTLVSMFLSKIEHEMYAKASLRFSKVGMRDTFSIFTMHSTPEFMRFLRWKTQIRVNISGAYAYATVTRVDEVNFNVEVAFKTFVEINEEEEHPIDLPFNDYHFFGFLKTLYLLEKGCGLHALYPKPIGLPDLKFFNTKCDAYANSDEADFIFNKSQKEAIFTIVNGIHGSVPYILWGPPGTGKTVTLVECVRQLLRKSSTNRILICTSSNTAADLFALKLLEKNAVRKSELRRYYGLSKHVDERNKALDSVVCMKPTPFFGEIVDMFHLDCPDEISKIRVFVTTLMFCSTMELDEPNFFSHIFIDEAGQATEVETMIPITRLGTQKTRLILSGDHQQLGPYVDSVLSTGPYKEKFASCTQSLMQRLMIDLRHTVYCDRRTMTKLKHSYRCHPAILEYPSKKFYVNDLSAPKETRSTLCTWEHLPNKSDFPIIFHLVGGSGEERDAGSKSYHNHAEVAIIVAYIQLLLKSDVLPSEIGIVSPYKDQTKKLKNKVHEEIAIGSVESFQGSERRVIIVTTARTSGIGFLNCNKRLNTFITRAMELLIVISSEGLLHKMADSTSNEDIEFLNFFSYCHENSAVVQNIVGIDPVIELEKKFASATNLESLVEKVRTVAKKKGAVTKEGRPKPSLWSGLFSANKPKPSSWAELFSANEPEHCFSNDHMQPSTSGYANDTPKIGNSDDNTQNSKPPGPTTTWASATRNKSRLPPAPVAKSNVFGLRPTSESSNIHPVERINKNAHSNAASNSGLSKKLSNKR